MVGLSNPWYHRGMAKVDIANPPVIYTSKELDKIFPNTPEGISALVSQLQSNLKASDQPEFPSLTLYNRLIKYLKTNPLTRNRPQLLPPAYFQEKDLITLQTQLANIFLATPPSPTSLAEAPLPQELTSAVPHLDIPETLSKPQQFQVDKYLKTQRLRIQKLASDNARRIFLGMDETTREQLARLSADIAAAIEDRFAQEIAASAYGPKELKILAKDADLLVKQVQTYLQTTPIDDPSEIINYLTQQAATHPQANHITHLAAGNILKLPPQQQQQASRQIGQSVINNNLVEAQLTRPYIFENQRLPTHTALTTSLSAKDKVREFIAATQVPISPSATSTLIETYSQNPGILNSDTQKALENLLGNIPPTSLQTPAFSRAYTAYTQKPTPQTAQALVEAINAPVLSQPESLTSQLIQSALSAQNPSVASTLEALDHALSQPSNPNIPSLIRQYNDQITTVAPDITPQKLSAAQITHETITQARLTLLDSQTQATLNSISQPLTSTSPQTILSRLNLLPDEPTPLKELAHTLYQGLTHAGLKPSTAQDVIDAIQSYTNLNPATAYDLEPALSQVLHRVFPKLSSEQINQVVYNSPYSTPIKQKFTRYLLDIQQHPEQVFLRESQLQDLLKDVPRHFWDEFIKSMGPEFSHLTSPQNLEEAQIIVRHAILKILTPNSPAEAKNIQTYLDKLAASGKLSITESQEFIQKDLPRIVEFKTRYHQQLLTAEQHFTVNEGSLVRRLRNRFLRWVFKQVSPETKHWILRQLSGIKNPDNQIFRLLSNRFGLAKPTFSKNFLVSLKNFFSNPAGAFRSFFSGGFKGAFSKLQISISKIPQVLSSIFGSGGPLSGVGGLFKSGLGSLGRGAVTAGRSLFSLGVKALPALASGLSALAVAAAPYVIGAVLIALISVTIVQLMRQPMQVAQITQVGGTGGYNDGYIAIFCAPDEPGCPTSLCPDCIGPVTCGSVTQCPGGTYSHSNLNAIDYGMASCSGQGLGVYTPRAGVVSAVVMGYNDDSGFAGSTDGYGNYVDITFKDEEDGRDFLFRFAHLVNQNNLVSRGIISSPFVVVSQEVETNALIGYADHTGNSTATHLHFELRALDNGSMPSLTTLIPGTNCP